MGTVQLRALTKTTPALPPATSNTDLGAGAGFVLLSTGADRRQLLWDCLDSIRRHYPQAPIHVISDAPVMDRNITCQWVDGWTGKKSRYLKTQLNRLTPFEVSVFIDDDAVIHRPFGQAAPWLGELDIAMSSDFPRVPLHSSHIQLRSDAQTRALCKGRETWVYHNSGVIIFRKSAATDQLFSAWHEEWLRTQDADQPPLLRARIRTEVPITTLPIYMNFIPHHDAHGKPVSKWEKALIAHWTRTKHSMPQKYFKAMNLPRGNPVKTFDAFSKALEKGRCERSHYAHIGRMIASIAPCRLLVFGTGFDSPLWQQLNANGKTLFIEDSQPWADKARNAGCVVQLVAYPTCRGVRATGPQFEAFAGSIEKNDWDIIFIDGPHGDDKSSPGRELPVMFAARFRSRSAIILHDYQRPWEYSISARHLGEPDLVLPSAKDGAALGVWKPSRQAIG